MKRQLSNYGPRPANGEPSAKRQKPRKPPVEMKERSPEGWLKHLHKCKPKKTKPEK